MFLCILDRPGTSFCSLLTAVIISDAFQVNLIGWATRNLFVMGGLSHWIHFIHSSLLSFPSLFNNEKILPPFFDWLMSGRYNGERGARVTSFVSFYWHCFVESTENDCLIKQTLKTQTMAVFSFFWVPEICFWGLESINCGIR